MPHRVGTWFELSELLLEGNDLRTGGHEKEILHVLETKGKLYTGEWKRFVRNGPVQVCFISGMMYSAYEADLPSAVWEWLGCSPRAVSCNLCLVGQKCRQRTREVGDSQSAGSSCLSLNKILQIWKSNPMTSVVASFLNFLHPSLL